MVVLGHFRLVVAALVIALAPATAHASGHFIRLVIGADVVPNAAVEVVVPINDEDMAGDDIKNKKVEDSSANATEAWGKTVGPVLDEGSAVDDIKNKTADECKQMCLDNPACNSFAYNADPWPWARTCHLKTKCVHQNAASIVDKPDYSTYYLRQCRAAAPTNPPPSMVLPECVNGTSVLEPYVEYNIGMALTLECSLRGAVGATVRVTDRIVFKGADVQLAGPLKFVGAGSAGCIQAPTDGRLTITGTVEFHGCHAHSDGGAIYAISSEVLFQSEWVLFENCWARTFGGAIAAKASNVTFKSGSVEFRNCSSTESGGAIYIYGAGVAAAGVLTLDGVEGHFQDCTSELGGALSGDVVFLIGSNVRFDRCFSKHGAVMAEHSVTLDGGNTTFIHCGASTSELVAGGINVLLGFLHYKSEARVEYLDVSNLHGQTATKSLRNDVEDGDGLHSCGPGKFVERSNRVDSLGWTTFLVTMQQKQNPTMKNFTVTECDFCPEGRFSLRSVWTMSFETGSTQDCQECQELEANAGGGAFDCRASWLKTSPGMMAVESSGEARAYRCPNMAACPGGGLEAALTGAVAQANGSMCASGYETAAPGCAVCAGGHARQSADPFTCTNCAHWFIITANFAALPVATFLWSVATVPTTALMADLTMTSDVTKILVSFGTLAAMVVPTLDLRQLQKAGTWWWRSITGPAEELSLAAPFSMNGGVDCMLQLLGIPVSLDYTLLAVFPVPLAALAAVLLWDVLASTGEARRCICLRHLIIWQNTFLPAIFASFAKQLTPIRLHAQDGRKLAWQPDQDWTTEKIMVGLIGTGVCIAIGPVFWYMLIQHMPFHENARSSSLGFLIAAYQEEFEFWEALTLLRKMLLMGAAVLFPASSNKGLLLPALLLIVGIAQLGNAEVAPFKSSDLGRLERRSLQISAGAIIASMAHSYGAWDWGEWWTGATALVAVLLLSINFAYLALRVLSARIYGRKAKQRVHPTDSVLNGDDDTETSEDSETAPAQWAARWMGRIGFGRLPSQRIEDDEDDSE